MFEYSAKYAPLHTIKIIIIKLTLTQKRGGKNTD